MDERLLTDDDYRPGTRIRYRNGTWATILHVIKPKGRDWQIKVWDDVWVVAAPTHDHGVWAERWYLAKIRATVGDPAKDPNPDIHKDWLHHAYRRRTT